MSDSKVAAQSDKESQPALNPHDLIKREDVEISLKADRGSHAELVSFEVKDFTKKGDNYACFVTSVEVKYKENEKLCETSFVTKLNPCRAMAFDKMTEIMFKKEIGVYKELLPLLNGELQNLNEEILRTPKLLHCVGKEFEQVIYLRDQRLFGYKMFDRKKGMDKAHTELILKELARFHAASVIFLSKEEFQGLDITERFPFLKEAFEEMQEGDGMSSVNEMFGPFVENSAKIAENNPGYQYVADFLRSKKPVVGDLIMKLLEPNDKFRVICHGDCWNNNFLFRYGEDGSPVECCLLDLQMVRVCSPVMDLNYMLYCSLEGRVRTEHMGSFFTSYYASFASVLAGAQLLVKFTMPQLQEEFYDKNMFGLIMGMMLIPIVLMDSDDAPVMGDIKGENVQEIMLEFQEKISEFVQKSELLSPRFLSLFDEMKENGLFDDDEVSSTADHLKSVGI